MKRHYNNLLFLICCLSAVSLAAQIDLKQEWIKIDPVAPGSTLSLEEKVKVHQDFVAQNARNNDTLKQIYGNIYLFYDYTETHNFSEATRYLLEAERLAKTAGNPGWQGWVAKRKGNLFIFLKNYKAAIEQFKMAATLCGQAKDSLCLAESLEQLSSMYGETRDYEQAHRYFELALPLVQRYGTNEQLASALNNFGNLLGSENRLAEAVIYFQKALLANQPLHDPRQANIFRNNLAVAYYELGNYQDSRKTFQECIRTSRENNWQEDLIYTYEAAADLFEKTGDYRTALDYFKQYHVLQDSIIGAKTQIEIANLEARYHAQQKELELQKSQAALATISLSLQRSVLMLSVILLLVAFGLWRWRSQTYQAQRELQQNQENLANVTTILLEKNKLLTELQEQTVQSSAKSEGLEEHLFQQRILTDTDWAAFKTYFEKVYPGYILRLRTAYPTLTDAEKRLFLFIKLNLGRKESAAILGISVDTVKKTRSRLRKRLELGEEEDLEAHIHGF